MFNNELIKKEYLRNLSLIKDDPFENERYISHSEILRAHYLVIDFFSTTEENITYGVKDINLLGSTLGRQVAGYGSYIKWKKTEEICATLFYGIIKNHAFHDANKRTGLLTLLYHLLKFGKTIDAKQKEFENLALCVASDTLKDYKLFRQNRYQRADDKEVRFIADFIKRNTRNIEKQYYPVTYQEFDTLLKKHGFYMDNPSGGFIDIVSNVKGKKFFGLKAIEFRRKYIQIGFLGWKRQINAKAVKEVLKATGLTADNGIDSKVFFRGAEPLTALIDQYKGPLIRLKDK